MNFVADAIRLSTKHEEMYAKIDQLDDLSEPNEIENESVIDGENLDDDPNYEDVEDEPVPEPESPAYKCSNVNMKLANMRPSLGTQVHF